MQGTFAFCRTSEAIKRMNDGDIVQNLENENYYRKEGNDILISDDCNRWRPFNEPMVTFPPYVEWRSLSDLHYFDDLKEEGRKLLFLTKDDRILDPSHTEADKNKKRWFVDDL